MSRHRKCRKIGYFDRYHPRLDFDDHIKFRDVKKLYKADWEHINTRLHWSWETHWMNSIGHMRDTYSAWGIKYTVTQSRLLYETSTNR